MTHKVKMQTEEDRDEYNIKKCCDTHFHNYVKREIK